MASNIDNTSIDSTFPVAGQDNDSQGFRNNFNTIKNNFTAAKNEIEDLQTNTAKLNAANNFLGNDVSGANLIANTEKHYPGGTVTGPTNVSFTNGHYQLIQVGADVTLTLADWPATNLMGKLRLQITSDGTPRDITWSVANGGALKYAADWPGTFTVTSQTNPIIVDFWTTNAGTTVFAQYHGQYT